MLPVVNADDALTDKLPRALLGFNVFFEDGFGDPKRATEALVDEVVAMAWQHRRRRKVFISYKRTDTEAHARRLYDRLGREGVEVFLDDATIPVGTLFQPALEAWLDDADAVLLLLSPNFHASHWTMHEVTTALNGGLGLLVVRWPGDGKAWAAIEAVLGKHGAVVGDGAVLEVTPALLAEPEALVARISAHLRTQRVNAVHQRMRALMAIARDVLGEAAVEPGPRPGDLVLADGGLVRALPHRPTLESLHRLHADAFGRPSVACLYYENSPHDDPALAGAWVDLARQQLSPTRLSVVPYDGGPLTAADLRREHMHADTLNDLDLDGETPLPVSSPVLFLSASVPERELDIYLPRPRQIAAAIAELCRHAFRRGYSIVFGGHPAITPLVLGAAERFADRGDDTRVVVVQSRHFEHKIPRAALLLADWRRGQLMWTADVDNDRDASLAHMRALMIEGTSYAAGIVVGGMDGCEDEAARFAESHPGAPLFALGATGGAALRLFERDDLTIGAGRADRALLKDNCESGERYPWGVVMRRIFEAIKP